MRELLLMPSALGDIGWWVQQDNWILLKMKNRSPDLLQAAFAATTGKQKFSLLFFMFFLLDQKERKNQESPNVASSQSLAATRPFIFYDRFIIFSRNIGYRVPVQNERGLEPLFIPSTGIMLPEPEFLVISL